MEEGQPFTVVVDYAHTDDALRNVISVGSRDEAPKRSDHAISDVVVTGTAQSVP